MATVVNLKHSKFDIYIGRSGYGRPESVFANPFKLNAGEDRGSTLARYEAYMRDRLSKEPELVTSLLALDGKVLGCFCKPHACHGDVLVKLINELKSKV